MAKDITLKKEKGRKKKVRRTIRLTQEEDKKLKSVMAVRGRKNFNTYALECLIPDYTRTEVKRVQKFDDKVVKELNDIGVNINQIAKKINSHLVPSLVQSDIELLNNLKQVFNTLLEKLLNDK